MDKWKKTALLFLTAVIIAACAALPGLVSRFRDDAAIGQIRYEPIPDILLQIREEDTASALKELAMISRMDGGLQLSESMASMSAAEAEARFYEIMEQYTDAGLVEVFDPKLYECRCILASVSVDPSLNGIYWSITLISGDDANFAQFDAAIDDETGKLLAVSYTGDRVFLEAEREEMLSGFTDLYFSGLEIPDYVHFVSSDIKGAYLGEDSRALRYHYVDSVYGEITADLFVNQYGFYTEFPALGVMDG